MANSTRRVPDGFGSVYQTPHDGLWRFAVSYRVDGKRYRKVRSNKSREIVEGFAAEYRATLPVVVKKTRAQLMVEARERGTHTPAELRKLHRNTPDSCRYCATPLNVFNAVVDHIQPVRQGGSDAIDNLQIICWECNLGKAESPDYRYVGPPRKFCPLPSRADSYNSMIAERNRRRANS